MDENNRENQDSISVNLDEIIIDTNTENLNEKEVPKILKINNKNIYKDYYFINNENKKPWDMLSFEKKEQDSFKNSVYFRVNAVKNIKLINFNFEHSFFEDCTLKNVVFEKCNFVNCKFKRCDFKETKFINCDFRYATFEGTFLESSILIDSTVIEHNLRRNLSRNLSCNFRDLNLTRQENFAISVELEAQEAFLKDAWSSEEEYYIKKYPGIKKFSKFLEWIFFKINKFIWGHGESLLRLLKSFLYILATIIIIVLLTQNTEDYYRNIIDIIQYVIGSIDKPDYFSNLLATLLVLMRIIYSGLIIVVLVKKIGR